MVLRAPERAAASTITVPQAMAAINRLRAKNRQLDLVVCSHLETVRLP
jgi:hypothetical protein